MKAPELDIIFPDKLSVKKPDAPFISLPKNLKWVDYVVEEADRYLLIEIKDPSYSGVPRKEHKRMKEKISQNQLADDEIVPKARGTYTFYTLMEWDSKPIDMVFLFGNRRIQIDAPLLLSLSDRIEKRLAKEASIPWKRQYIRNFALMTEADWQKKFPQYPLIGIEPGL